MTRDASPCSDARRPISATPATEPAQPARAALELASKLQARAQTEQARELYERLVGDSIASDDRAALVAAFRLSGIYTDQGDPGRAEAVTRMMVAAGHVVESPLAALRLAEMLSARGDEAGVAAARAEAEALIAAAAAAGVPAGMRKPLAAKLEQLGIESALLVRVGASVPPDEALQGPVDLSKLVELREPLDQQDANSPVFATLAMAIETSVAATAHRCPRIDQAALSEAAERQAALAPQEQQSALAAALNVVSSTGGTDEQLNRYQVQVFRLAGLGQIPDTLRRGRPIVAEIRVFSEWWGVIADEDDWIDYCDDPDSFIGTTAFMIVASHQSWLRVASGWGPGWGAGGFARMTWRAAEQCIDTNVLAAIEAAPAPAS